VFHIVHKQEQKQRIVSPRKQIGVRRIQTRASSGADLYSRRVTSAHNTTVIGWNTAPCCKMKITLHKPHGIAVTFNSGGALSSLLEM